MFMKTSVPYSYKFLILVWTIPDSSFESKLTIERFTKEQIESVILENCTYKVLHPAETFICMKHGVKNW